MPAGPDAPAGATPGLPCLAGSQGQRQQGQQQHQAVDVLQHGLAERKEQAGEQVAQQLAQGVAQPQGLQGGAIRPQELLLEGKPAHPAADSEQQHGQQGPERGGAGELEADAQQGHRTGQLEAVAAAGPQGQRQQGRQGTQGRQQAVDQR